MNKPRYHLELEPVPGNWRTPPLQRLRAALKCLLRAFGLRAIVCRPVQGEGLRTALVHNQISPNGKKKGEGLLSTLESNQIAVGTAHKWEAMAPDTKEDKQP